MFTLKKQKFINEFMKSFDSVKMYDLICHICKDWFASKYTNEA